MPYLIGVDEAGYAPNLGPLVIAVTAWQIQDQGTEVDLYRSLRRVVCRTPAKRGNPRRVAIADSKQLYSPAIGLAALERGVLAMLASTGCCAGDWQEIWRELNVDTAGHFPLLPWHVDYQAALPLAADKEDLVALVPFVRDGLAAAGVRLLILRSTAVFPEYFNDCTTRYGNKGEALSKLTLQLLADVLALCDDEPVMIVCDRHGGRSRYGRLLQEQFPDPLIEVHSEQPLESTYRWGPAERRISIHFRVGGEAFLPVALASMTAKYLRELAMRAFNDYWCRRVADLRPTAGYPGDSRRFKAAIGAAQAELGIDDHVLWRAR